jgi:hypothetical protein
MFQANGSLERICKLLTFSSGNLNYFFSHFINTMIEMLVSNIFSEVVAAMSNDPAFDSYVYLAYRNDESGIVGIAYSRSTCNEYVNVRTSLNEYQRGDLNTGLVSNALLKYFIHSSMESDKSLTFPISCSCDLIVTAK